MRFLDWMNPGRWLLLAALAAALFFGIPLIVHRYDEARRDEGRQERAEETRIAAEEQTAKNRDLQRAAEKRYVVQAETRTRYLTKTTTEVRYAAAPLASCPVPEPARVQLNAAAACARGDPAAACGADGKVPAAR